MLPMDDLWFYAVLFAAGVAAWFAGRNIVWGRGPLFGWALTLIVLCNERAHGTVVGEVQPVADYAVINWVFGSDLGGYELISPSVTYNNSTGVYTGISIGGDYPAGGFQPNGTATPYDSNWNLWYAIGNVAALNGNYAVNQMTATVPLVVQPDGSEQGSFILGRHPVYSATVPVNGPPFKFLEAQTETISFTPGNAYVSFSGIASGKVFFSGYAGAGLGPLVLVFEGDDAGNSAPSSVIASQFKYNSTPGSYTFIGPQWIATSPYVASIGSVTLYVSNATTQPTTVPTTQISVTTQPSDFQEAKTMLDYDREANPDDGDKSLFGYMQNHNVGQSSDPNRPTYVPNAKLQDAQIPTDCGDAGLYLSQLLPSNMAWSNPIGHGSLQGTTPVFGQHWDEYPIYGYIFAGVDAMRNGTGTCNGLTLTDPIPNLLPWIRSIVDIAIVWRTFKWTLFRIVRSLGMNANAEDVPPPLELPGEELAL